MVCQQLYESKMQLKIRFVFVLFYIIQLFLSCYAAIFNHIDQNCMTFYNHVISDNLIFSTNSPIYIYYIDIYILIVSIFKEIIQFRSQNCLPWAVSQTCLNYRPNKYCQRMSLAQLLFCYRQQAYIPANTSCLYFLSALFDCLAYPS